MLQAAEITIQYKPALSSDMMHTITKSSDAYEIFKSTWSENISYIEEFKIILLNSSNKVLGVSKISEGGICGTIADPRLVFQRALLANATAVILAHNHPSGNLKPSQADINLTKSLQNAGAFLEIRVLDHIVVTENGYYSFADEGII